MRRNDAFRLLTGLADPIKAMGATALFVYGSTASDSGGPESDVDIFIEYDMTGKFNAFDLLDIKELLEKEMRVPIDLTTRDGLHSRLKPQIEQSALCVF
jgi:uncharacterized protein